MASEGFEAIWRSGVGSSPEPLELVIEPHLESDIELSTEAEEATVELLAESVEPASKTQAEPADELHAQPLESANQPVVDLPPG
ncbi:hypothetical protein Nepgr_006914 [Nepenthes gracilis]|uniref:Uncharacterized protein n=1 Tax=Nepenthes gracilis TaxID=150966 RepID=A0AAD3S629_NEPGR|nr:hypothetical protein Nepgr_006914 [Nepenthes gracilis]